MLEALSSLLSQLPPGTAEAVGTWVAALLTLAVLSYVFGPNPIFRLAEHLFVGLAAGYAGALAWNQVLLPRLRLLLGDPIAYWYYGLFFLLGLLLLARGFKPLSVLANLPLGVLFGVGAALALGGALTGSLIPQVRAAVVSVVPVDYGQGLAGWAYALDAVLLILGTIAVLSAFHFTAQGRGPLSALWYGLIKALGRAGRVLLMVTFGALFAGAAFTFFAVLSSRLAYLVEHWLKLLNSMGL